MADKWFSMAADIERTCYDHASRYTTSAFMRLKLGDALSRRNVAPHIFETSADAHQFVSNRPMELKSPELRGALKYPRIGLKDDRWRPTGPDRCEG